MRTYKNLIGGEWVGSVSGTTFQTRNPACIDEVVGEYPASGRVEARQALDAAAVAFSGWAGQTPVARGRVLSQAAVVLAGRKKELAELLTREEGKTVAEATGEVQRAIDIFRFYGGVSYTLGGQTLPHDLPGNFLFTRREPLGVVALITPWNFPVAIPTWKLVPALLCGNAVVLKPASAAPALTCELAKALTEAGLPPGVLNVVTGDGRSFGDEVVQHRAVAGVSFTGSRGIGTQLYTNLAPRMVRSQMEMGGKNPTLVLADADLDLAAKLVAIAGFGLTGQACTATSRVIVERPVLEAFTEKLIAKARAMVVGNGLKDGVTMGPAVSEGQLQTNLDYVGIATQEGGTVLTGGRRLTEGDHARGWFMEPTVIGNVKPTSRLACEEVFGPVVGIIGVDNFDEAIAVANGVEFGLSASLVTRDFAKAMRYVDRIQAGVVKVNQVSTGLALQAPFGGVKGSSTDTFREQGLAALDFYSRTRTVYLDYSA
ncbi:MAG: aldehyde dehydrogenase family protein [Verrucomicrobiales bacterium]|nr:aldehyde dehydrogenase family protein [Verrucomicrobiales bacterium]